MKKLDILIVAAALILCAVLLAMNFAGAAIETANWGLSFQTKGLSPDAPEPPEKLEKYGGYYLGDPEKKTVYLTFDAGYENGCTAKILDVLKKSRFRRRSSSPATTWSAIPIWCGGWRRKGTSWATTPCTTRT